MKSSNLGTPVHHHQRQGVKFEAGRDREHSGKCRLGPKCGAHGIHEKDFSLHSGGF